jgi:hypothetical protein
MIQTMVKSRAKQANGNLRVHRFTVAEYHQMIDAGILTTAHKVELLEGWIVDKMPQNPPHITAISRLYRWLSKILPDEDWTLRGQGPITLQESEPEPDLVIARGPDRRYEKRHPGPGDIVLVIEVADSTLMEDRRHKGSLYAGAKIPEFWLVNLQARHAEIYTNPQSGRSPFYRHMVELSSTDAIPLVLSDKRMGELKVKHLLS